MRWKEIHQGRVEAVLVTPFGRSRSEVLDEIQVHVGEGIRGDRHCGTRLSDAREVVLKSIGVGKEVPITNVRQFSAVSIEELAEISEVMMTPEQIPFGCLGENLVVAGIPGFTSLPAGTLLTFSKQDGERKTRRKAVLAVWGENTPCHVPEESIVQHFGEAGRVFKPAKPFGSAARLRRGVVGFVYCSGKIKPGDYMSVWGVQAPRQCP